ncbi:hypothetical protein ABH933_001247 [Nocardia sp. GP40]|uniref:DUF4254 domain-containing protein n=1 Tax=Nocardia sp. GP40 TaxID=3156268 RepID=UPI003D25A8EC
MTAPPGDPGLPDWHELEDAFISNCWASTHPVTRCACELARLHRRRGLRRRPVAVCRRARLIAAIDAWAIEHVRGLEVSGSLGVHVDRMAAAVVAAHRLLRTCDSVSESVRAAFADAAVLAARWTEIITATVPRHYGELVTDEG